MDELTEKTAKFSALAQPREELLSEIMAQIKTAQQRRIKLRLIFWSAIFGLSAIALLPAFNLFSQAIKDSDFMEFFSLIFSDSGVVATYWNSFALSLLEALPIMSLLILLSVVVVFLTALRQWAKTIKIVSNLKLSHN